MTQTIAEALIEEGRKEGELRDARRVLCVLLRDRFPGLPEGLVERIDALEDLERLHSAIRQVYRVDKPDDLPL
jgi:hypothetical protein